MPKIKNGDNKKKEYSLDEMNIIARIPLLTTSYSISATVMVDGKLITVRKDIDLAGIHREREAFLNNVEFGDDYDASFVITGDGRKLLEQMRDTQ